MNEYAWSALLAAVVTGLWWYVRRTPHPAQLEPMTARWLHEIRRRRET